MRRRFLLSVLLAASLALGACAGRDGAESASKDSSPPAAPASPSASLSPGAMATDGAAEDAVIEDLLREPGPYAGDEFDVDAAVAAVRAEKPGSAQEWAEVLVAATHGDYATATQGLLDFDPSIEEDPDEPSARAERVGGVEVVGRNHFGVVLDASGSMAERVDGQTRMKVAKAAVREFASRLPQESTLSLRVYGHQGSNARADKATSCAATEVVYSGPPKGVARSLSTFTPTGWTPLAKSIAAVRQDIPAEASDAIVYVVTDGLETCGGNPVEAARALAADGVKPVVNVIGFEVGNADRASLRKIAEAGGGEFVDARSGADLRKYWEADRRQMMDAWTAWKHQALQRIDRQGRANLEAADALGRTLLDGLDAEWEGQKELLEALASEHAVEPDVKSEVWSTLYARKGVLWSWSYAKKTASWSSAYEVKTSRWSEAYTLGSGTWSEYYRQKSPPR